MSVSEMQQAERASRARAVLMAIMALILVVQMFLGVGNELDSARPLARHGAWGVMVLLWVAILYTGGGLRLSARLRRVMNDEVSLANRKWALQVGFWMAIALGVGLYFIGPGWELSLRDGLRILVNGALAAALAAYAWAELR